MTLLLFMLRSKKRLHIDRHIKNIVHINEVALILGLTLLVIGNFLGGIWANESWGRYWGWDPKETWAYVSILVYAIVLHLRLLKSVYSPYLFSVLSVMAFFSILMTYFGVNFYLAGLHSYATGDPVPIPNWVYILTGIVVSLILISYPKRKLINLKKYE
jgi:ABC-type transport system involved in cytochrome c biogenesis permease subunit